MKVDLSELQQNVTQLNSRTKQWIKDITQQLQQQKTTSSPESSNPISDKYIEEINSKIEGVENEIQVNSELILQIKQNIAQKDEDVELLRIDLEELRINSTLDKEQTDKNAELLKQIQSQLGTQDKIDENGD